MNRMPLPIQPAAWLLCAVVISGAPGSTAAPARADATAPPQAARAKIDPWVVERASAGQQAEFIVVMADQADLSRAVSLPDKASKGRFVRDALLAKAAATQAPLLAWLNAKGLPHRSFYIVNAVLVTATLGAAEEIAARHDVARIDGNPVVAGVEPAVLTPEEIRAATNRALSPSAIEPGVSYIRAPEVWAMGATGQGIVIGGADTGVDWTHPALQARYRGWNGATANHDYNWHDSIHSGGGACGPDSPAPCDDFGHGTHTIGTAVGADAGGTNQIGVAPGAKFIACRNMDQGNGTPATYLECMEWFLAPYPAGGTPAQGDPSKAPDLTTNSWTCPPAEGCLTATLQAGVEAQRAAGILFVAAAGNSGPSCSTVFHPPGLYEAAYSVGAFSASTGTIAGFSSRGPVTADGSNRIKPDVTAPGVGVRSALPGGAYGALDGTSMATPHVAGAVALLWSAHPELRNRVQQTEDILDQSAVDVSATSCSSGGVPNDVYGWGRLDIKAAVDLGPVAVAPTAPEGPGDGAVWLAPAFPNPAHRSTLLRFRLDREGDVDLAILSSAGQRIRTLAQGMRAAGEHAIRWDGANGRGEAVAAGVYLVQLQSRGRMAGGKLIWLGP